MRATRYVKDAETTLTNASYVTLVAGVASFRLKIIEVVATNTGSGDVSLILRDGAAGDTQTFALTAPGSLSFGPHLPMTAGNGLQAALSAAGTVKVSVYWTLEK